MKKITYIVLLSMVSGLAYSQNYPVMLSPFDSDPGKGIIIKDKEPNIFLGIGVLSSGQIEHSIKIRDKTPSYFTGNRGYTTLTFDYQPSFNDFDFGIKRSILTTEKSHFSIGSSIGRILRDRWWLEEKTWTKNGYFYESTYTYAEENGDTASFWGLSLSYSRNITEKFLIESTLLGRMSLFSHPHTWYRMDIGISLYYRI